MMKVAIIGAGISGLACAFELEKHGITPTIFEKRHAIGEKLGYTALWTKLITRCKGDAVEHMMNEYGLKLSPLSRVKQTVMVSASERTISNGQQGYLFRRGDDAHSLENQIAAQIKTPIQFNTFIELEDIRNQFDCIVVATSTSYIPQKLHLWTDTFLSQSRVAMVLGNFDMNSATVWFNTDYANKGFCYLVPNSPKEATLALIVNDSVTREIDFYWNNFLAGEGISYNIVDKKDAEHTCGILSTGVLDNIYFVGNAGGFTDDLIGVGSYNAIESGIFAARAIAGQGDYNQMIAPIWEDVAKLHELRKFFNTFENADYDRYVAFLGAIGINQLIYQTSFVKFTQVAPIIEFYNKLKGKS